MTKEIIVNVGENETRIAVLENGKLAELHVERGERVVGSLYKARVENVLPGMDAAFVDIGLGRNAFLHVGDVLPGSSLDADDEDEAGGNGTEGSHNGGRRKLLKRAHRKQQHITQLLKKGQELVVQVIKGPRGSKGARVSTLISLPGRYLVFMPEAEAIGVSRKITDRSERTRLRRIAEALRGPGCGIIMRTEAEGKAETDLAADYEQLAELWQDVQEKARTSRAPCLLHQELSLVSKAVRDLFGSDVSRLVVDDPDEYQEIHNALANASPMLRDRIHLYTGPVPVFAHFGLEPEIERNLKPKVWLKSGGYLIIEVSEALTVVDVNTGKYTGGASLADTILRTNMEAAVEIARQLRLRDIGGIIVIDFIDMANPRDRQQVYSTLEAAVQADKARTRIYPIGPLGLVEMTRKRTKETVLDYLNEPCEYCAGRGSLPSPETVAATIEREIMAAALDAGNRKDAILVYCSPGAAEYLIGDEGANVDRLEQRTRKALFVRARFDMPTDRYEIHLRTTADLEQEMPRLRHDDLVEGRVATSRMQPDGAAAVAWVNGLLVDLDDGVRYVGQSAKIRIRTARRSYATGAVVPERSLTSVRTSC